MPISWWMCAFTQPVLWWGNAPLRGTDEKVYDFVMSQPETEEFYKLFMNLIEYTLPGYRRKGKSSLTIAIGCTGGTIVPWP